MNENTNIANVDAELERKHFVRAALAAQSSNLPSDRIRDLQIKALDQMSATFRNAGGTKQLAMQFGISKEELKNILENYMEDRISREDVRDLEPCYDPATGDYLSFEQWISLLIKRWDRLPGATSADTAGILNRS